MIQLLYIIDCESEWTAYDCKLLIMNQEEMVTLLRITDGESGM